MQAFVASDTNGFKRTVAAALLVLIQLLNTLPGCEAWAQALVPIAALFGAAGITNASLAGTLSKAKLAGIAAAISILLFAAHFSPSLRPYVPFLEALAALFGTAGLTLVTPPVAKALRASAFSEGAIDCTRS